MGRHGGEQACMHALVGRPARVAAQCGVVLLRALAAGATRPLALAGGSLPVGHVGGSAGG